MYEEVARGVVEKRAADEKTRGVIKRFVKEEPGEARRRVNELLGEYVGKWNSLIEGVHVSGFDPRAYEERRNTTRRLAGSHLPINFTGAAGGRVVEDWVDHAAYDALLHPGAPLIIEILPPDGPPTSDGEEWLSWVKASRGALEGILARAGAGGEGAGPKRNAL